MTEFKKYHAAIEIKDIASLFLRQMEKINVLVNESEEIELISKFNEAVKSCEELYKVASSVALTEKPPEREIKDSDRGINEFLSYRSCGCDDDCNGGNCGNCSSNGGGCQP
jgi:hypothetical protein